MPSDLHHVRFDEVPPQSEGAVGGMVAGWRVSPTPTLL